MNVVVVVAYLSLSLSPFPGQSLFTQKCTFFFSLMSIRICGRGLRSQPLTLTCATLGVCVCVYVQCAHTRTHANVIGAKGSTHVQFENHTMGRV